MKKFLSMTLAILMIFLALPITVMAAPDGYDATADCFVALTADAEKTPVKDGLSLYDAFQWVYDQANSEEYTIYLEQDVYTSQRMEPDAFDLTAVKTITIDGGNHTLYSTAIDNGMFRGMTVYNLTLKNLNMNVTTDDSLDWSPKLTDADTVVDSLASLPTTTDEDGKKVATTVLIDNCTLTPGDTMAGTVKFNVAEKAPADVYYKVTIKDSEFTSNNQFMMFYTQNKINLDLTVEGSTFNHISSTPFSATDIRAYAMFQTESGAKLDLTVRNSSTNTALLNSSTGFNKTDKQTGIFCTWTGNETVNATFEQGVQIKWNTPSAMPQTMLSSLKDGASVTITDKGAQYILGKEALAAGATVTLNNITDANGNAVTWLEDEQGRPAPSAYTNTLALADTKLTALSLNLIGAECEILDANDTAVTELGDYTADTLTLNQAYKWVYAQENSEDYTIALLRDVVTSEALQPTSFTNTNIKTVKIDGAKTDGRWKLISTSTMGIAHGIGLFNLTLKNIDMYSSCGDSLDWSPKIVGVSTNDKHEGSVAADQLLGGSDTLLENCTLAPISGTRAGTLKLNAGVDDALKENAPYNVKIKNSELTCNNQFMMFYALNGALINLTIEGSAVTNEHSTVWDTNAAAAYSMFYAEQGGKLVLNVKNSETNDAILNIAPKLDHWTGVLCTRGAETNLLAGTINATFEKGASVKFNNAHAVEQRLISQNKGTITVVDNGANWIAGKEALAAGATVILPAESTKWFMGDDGVFEGNSYTNAAPTEDVVFTRIGSFATLEGASVRTDSPAGIRFEAEFDESLLENEDVTVGILLTTYNPNAPLTAESFTVEGLEGKNFIDQVGEAGKLAEVDGKTVLRVALTGIPHTADAYETMFAARAYIKVGDTYCYSDFNTDDNARSLYDVAKKAVELDAYKNNAFLNSIIELVENA